MRRKIFSLALILSILSVLSFAQKPFKHKKIDMYVAKHNSIAILPFIVKSKPKKMPEGMTMEMLKESEVERGYAMQSSMYSYFVKKKKNNKIDFQDSDETNRILKKNEINYENFLDKKPGELAKILGVDAIIISKATTDEPLTEGAKLAATAKSLALGLGSSKVTSSISIYSGDDSELIWRWEGTVKGGVTDSDACTEAIMQYVSKVFPYKKKKN